MGLKFEPMQESDYLQIGKEVKDGFDSQTPYLPASLTSPIIFGSEEYASGEDRPLAIDHRRGYIHLCRPVLNYAMVSKGDLKPLTTILSQDKSLVKNVLDFTVCYCQDTGEYLDAAEAEDGEGFLWGAEVVRMWLEELDIEEEIIAELSLAMGEYVKGTTKYGVGKFRRGKSGGYIACGDWRFYPDDDATYEGLAEWIGRNVFTSDESRLSYLINLQGHKERLNAFILDYITVVPLGVRPDIQSRHDKLSWLYDDIISADKNLRTSMRGMFDVKAFTDQYRRLSNAVSALLVEPPSYRSNRKSILQTLSGKQGDIRSKMLGKRVDYSGRSVITIDPYLSLRKIKVPKDLAPKLFRSHILESLQNPNLADWVGPDKRDKCNSRLQEKGILDKVPVLIGRQPTLHKLSMRAFEAELTDERSIRINPLCVTGFNADFDGDQMWLRVPVGSSAVEEVKDLMSIQQNIYDPKNGSCSVMPRQEIIYGLNVCTRSTLQKGTSQKTYSSAEELRSDLYAQRIQVEDTVTWNGYTDVAGRVAFASCIMPQVWKELGSTEITSKSIKKYVERMVEIDKDAAIDSLDLLVELGFRISYLYPPTLNLLDEEDISYHKEMEDFHTNPELQETTYYYDQGMEEESKYDAAYDSAFSACVEEVVKESIYDRVGRESGFVRLAESGARGSKSNLVQMYGYKGRIQKSSHESFRAVIEHSYVDQLTPLEHFVTAYGGRQGLINKSLNTADTGYASRKMWHAASPFVITCDDCGTTEGIDIRKVDILSFIGDKDEADQIFCKIITGRHLASDGSYISAERAKELCKNHSHVTIRSILTCKDPCCKKCYGDDPATHRTAAEGLPIGFIAAHSIGEPGTQLSMDSFKKGGIASKGRVTSSFEKLEAYIECRSLAGNSRIGSYDPVAWETGDVRSIPTTDGCKKVTIGSSRKTLKLPLDAPIRDHVEKGEGISIVRGDYSMDELLQNTDLKTAQTYFIHTLYHIYKDECEISMKHFEILAAAMTMHMVIATDRDDLYVGQYHDSIQLHKGSLENTVYISTMKGVKQVQPSRPMPLCRVLLESVQKGLASSVLLGLEDSMEYPLNRIMMGQDIYCGTALDSFVSERKL